MQFGKRFLDSSRGQVVALLRRGPRTVEELAQAIGLTDNAVRNHLVSLERDGLVRAEGVRRGTGAGKPAVVYELMPDAGTLFSRAYPPVLSTVVDVLFDKLPLDAAEPLLREVGHRLARGVGGPARGTLDTRVRAAAAVLTELGGDVEVIEEPGARRIQGSGCPLAAVVRDHPAVCMAVETLIGDVAAAPTRSCCEHGDTPRCRFEVRDPEG